MTDTKAIEIRTNTSVEPTFVWVEPESIQVIGGRNPRKYFDPADVGLLAKSLIEGGMHTPIIVNTVLSDGVTEDTYDTYELITGERRIRAAIQAGISKIPCLAYNNLDDKEVKSIALTDNLARKDITAFDAALGVKAAKDAGLSYAEISRRAGKGEDWAAQHARILNLPESIHHCFIGADALSYTFGTDLLRLLNGYEKELVELAVKAYETKMTRAELRRQIAIILGEETAVLSPAAADAEDWLFDSAYGKYFGKIKPGHGGKGEITLKYDSDAGLAELLKMMERGVLSGGGGDDREQADDGSEVWDGELDDDTGVGVEVLSDGGSDAEQADEVLSGADTGFTGDDTAGDATEVSNDGSGAVLSGIGSNDDVAEYIRMSSVIRTRRLRGL